MLKVATTRKHSGGTVRIGFDRVAIEMPRRPGSPGTQVEPRERGTGLGRVLVARVAGSAPCRGKIVLGTGVIPCALGRAGMRRRKREGDGTTPIGTWAPVAAFTRRDRMRIGSCGLPRRDIRLADGWCDDPASRLYNRPVTLPARAGHEALWRADGLYDVVVVLDHNLRAPARGRGSAVFLHVAGAGFAPTAGCIAVDQAAMRRLLPRLDPRTRFVVTG